MSKRKVLVVEDVDQMRELLGQLLESTRGYEVSGLARNGIEARFELVRRHPDLVLLDEVLPGESCLDLLQELRRQGMPVVLLTSLAGRSEDPSTLPEGALGRLLKPTWRTLAADVARIEGELEKLLTGGG